ncbi:hypothetical protein PanWU01x14_113490, partial [Parasponia andersonii]
PWYLNTKALIKCRGRCLLQCLILIKSWKMPFMAPPRHIDRHLLQRLIGGLVDLPRRLISTFVAKAYYGTYNQGAFVSTVKGLSRNL